MRLLLPLLLLLPGPALADVAGDERNLSILQELDGRLATIGDRIATANRALCDQRQPAPGWVLHALDQYAPALRPAARSVFGFATGVAVQAVVQGGPAARAGVLPNDGIVAINAVAVPAIAEGPATSASRDAVNERLADLPDDRPLTITILRDGGRRDITLRPEPACRAAFEIVVGRKPVADSDGRTVQVGAPYFARFNDDDVAVIVAHELAHIILRHRARLEAAGVHWGALAGLGRNARLFRRTEDEADALGAVLLRNAGYDPQIAVRFWQRGVGGLAGSLLHSPTHGSSGERARAIAAAIASIPPGAPVPWIPPLIATRDQPLR